MSNHTITRFAADNRLVQRLPSSICPCRVPLHGPVQFAIIRGISFVGQMFSPKLPFPLGYRRPHVTHCSSSQAHSLPKLYLDQFSRFCIGLKCYDVQCFVSGEENPQKCPVPLPWDLVTLPEEDRATTYGHRQHVQKFGKNRACGYGYIFTRTDIHTYTQTYSSQYFTTRSRGRSNYKPHVLSYSCVNVS